MFVSSITTAPTCIQRLGVHVDFQAFAASLKHPFFIAVAYKRGWKTHNFAKRWSCSERLMRRKNDAEKGGDNKVVNIWKLIPPEHSGYYSSGGSILKSDADTRK